MIFRTINKFDFLWEVIIQMTEMQGILGQILDPILYSLALEIVNEITNQYSLISKERKGVSRITLLNFAATCQMTWNKHQLLMKPAKRLENGRRRSTVYYGLIRHGLCEGCRVSRGMFGETVYYFNVYSHHFHVQIHFIPDIHYCICGNCVSLEIRVDNDVVCFDVDNHSVNNLDELLHVVRKIGSNELQLTNYAVSNPIAQGMYEMVYSSDKNAQLYVEMEEKARQIYTDYLADFQNYK